MKDLPTGVEPAAPPREHERELTGEEPIVRVVPPRVLVPRWVQLVLLPIALLALWALAKAAGKVVLLFIFASVIALILNPPVTMLQRRRLTRGLAVLAVYAVFFLILAGVGLLLANPISHQVSSFSHTIPHLVHEANSSLAELQHSLNQNGVHVHFITQGKTAIQTLGDKLAQGSSSVVTFGGDVLTEVVSAGFDVIVVFVLSIYMLIYGPSIGRLVRRVMPPGDGTAADDYPTLVQTALARYVGGQLIFSFVMGTTVAIALYIFGVLGIFPDGKTYAVVFGIFFGVMELIPYIGPFLGALPPVLVAFINNPISALWVGLLFVALQQLEGHLVAPQIFGHTLRINPILVILALLIGLQASGFIGALIALPLLAIARETAVYLSRHLELESWNRSGDGML
ncbi:MAG TPA: AI-2E family transporter [Solirubrobacteraceae bacterium]|nr:AI-2E family transporter [Solirubrobacteraceae bacterium]